jgi:hypothetical protein
MKMQLVITLEEGKKLELSEEEAKELYGKLNMIFGEKKEYIPYPTYPTYPWYTITTPQPYNPYIPPYVITCGDIPGTCSSDSTKINTNTCLGTFKTEENYIS